MTITTKRLNNKVINKIKPAVFMVEPPYIISPPYHYDKYAQMQSHITSTSIPNVINTRIPFHINMKVDILLNASKLNIWGEYMYVGRITFECDINDIKNTMNVYGTRVNHLDKSRDDFFDNMALHKRVLWELNINEEIIISVIVHVRFLENNYTEHIFELEYTQNNNNFKCRYYFERQKYFVIKE